MTMVIFDAGISLRFRRRGPRGRIELTSVGESEQPRSDHQRPEDPVDPIKVGDIVYSASMVAERADEICAAWARWT